MRQDTQWGNHRLSIIITLLVMGLVGGLSRPGSVEADTVVTDPSAGTDSHGALFRVNPITGARTLLSDFGAAGQGPLGSNPLGVAVSGAASPPTPTSRPMARMGR